MSTGLRNNYFNNCGSKFSQFLNRFIRLDYVSGLPLLRACASYYKSYGSYSIGVRLLRLIFLLLRILFMIISFRYDF